MFCFTSIEKELESGGGRAHALGPQCSGSYRELPLPTQTLSMSVHVSGLEFPSQENRLPLGSLHVSLVGL